MTNKLSIVLVAILIALAPISAFAQQIEDFIRPFFGFYDSQSLTSAIGRATVASGQIIPGKTTNPANLGLQRFSTVQTNFLSGKFDNQSSSVSSSNIGGLYAVLPVKVFQGSLVYGLGIQKQIDFSNAIKTEDYRYLEEGGIYATEVGFAVEYSQNLFIGADFQYLSGQNEVSTVDANRSGFLNPKYRGFSASFGFIQRTTPHLQIGGSVELPAYIWVKDKYQTWETGYPERKNSETWEYRLARPLVFHFGGALLYKYVNIFYELDWSDWKNLDFASDHYYEGDIIDINQEIKDELRSVMNHHIGVAVHQPWLPVHLFGGYQYLPTPYSGTYDDNRRQSLSAGASYMLNQQFSIHGSHTNYFWKQAGKKENYRHTIFGISMHF